jgi:hypothetical protein
MPKMAWTDFLEQFPRAHRIIATLPATADEGKLNARAAQQLLERLCKNLGLLGQYAVAVSRQSGQCQIVCAFSRDGDAALAADAARAVTDHETADRYYVLLDEAAKRRIDKLRDRAPRIPRRARIEP